MSWLRPIQCTFPKNIFRKDGARMPDTSKAVTVNGVRYRSITAACQALECSPSKIYRLIGERWRYDKKAA